MPGELLFHYVSLAACMDLVRFLRSDGWHWGEGLRLFAIDDTESIHIFSPDAELTPQVCWSLLVQTQEKAQE